MKAQKEKKKEKREALMRSLKQGAQMIGEKIKDSGMLEKGLDFAKKELNDFMDDFDDDD